MLANPHLDVVNAFVDSLWRAGLREVCISPGSRSTPLTMAFTRHGEFRLWTLLDERSAGFFALGLARTSGRATALVCTSGTATGNYLPAVMEASYGEVPLLVLTADRPPELHETGSNQTLHQSQLYEPFVKWSIDMPVPDGSEGLIRHAIAMASRSVSAATSMPSGPVHLNWPFREPLVPPTRDTASGLEDPRHPKTAWVFAPELMPSPEAVDALTELLSQSVRPLLVCGPQDDVAFARKLMGLGAALNAPVLADPLSQLRTGQRPDGVVVVDRADILLRDKRWYERLAPDLIIRFGAVPTSKAVGQFLAEQHEAQQVVVGTMRRTPDPWNSATHVVQANPTHFCDALARADLVPSGELANTRNAWTLRWSQLNQVVDTTVKSVMADDTELLGSHDGERNFEGRVVLELESLLEDGTCSLVYVGNSMPVRDFDSFLGHVAQPVRVLGNRGVSGIDGVVSSAVGAAAGHGGPSLLVIGDVSFYHDLNGLLPTLTAGVSLVVILIHNDGGGIFQFLPQANHTDTFHQFRTPHGLGFQGVVEMYGGCFRPVAGWDEFRREVRAGWERSGLTVVEVSSDAKVNTKLHADLFAACQRAVERYLEVPKG